MPRAIALMHPRRSQVAPPPAELGEVLDAEQIRAKFFGGRVSRDYVLDHVAPNEKFYMGKAAVWYEGHVTAWMPLFVKDQQERAARRRRKEA